MVVPQQLARFGHRARLAGAPGMTVARRQLQGAQRGEPLCAVRTHCIEARAA
jgi:hypothetical protein